MNSESRGKGGTGLQGTEMGLVGWVGCPWWDVGQARRKSRSQTGECAGRSWGGELDWRGEMGAMEGSRAAEELVAWLL